MKKTAAALLALLILLLSGVSYAADLSTQRIDPFNFSIRFPSDSEWLLFTRDLAEDDPSLLALGTDAQAVLANFRDNDIYLNSVKKDISAEYTLVCSTSEKSEAIFNYSLLEDEKLAEMTENAIAHDYSAETPGLSYSSCNIYKGDNITWLLLKGQIAGKDAEGNDAPIYLEQLNTVVNGISVSVTVHSFTGAIDADMDQTLKQVASSLVWDEILVKESSGIDLFKLGLLAAAALIVIIVIIVFARAGRKSSAIAKRSAAADTEDKADDTQQ